MECRDPQMRVWLAAENARQDAIDVRSNTLAGEELERWWDLEADYFDEAARTAASGAGFALWRASVNENANPPLQHKIPADYVLEEKTLISGNLRDDATPGSDKPTVARRFGVTVGFLFCAFKPPSRPAVFIMVFVASGSNYGSWELSMEASFGAHSV